MEYSVIMVINWCENVVESAKPLAAYDWWQQESYKVNK